MLRLLIILDDWFEEDTPIYVHPKDPYKRIEILPSSRTITAKVDGVTIAESSNNMFLFETTLRTRFYMPKTAVSVVPAPRNSTYLKLALSLTGTLGIPH